MQERGSRYRHSADTRDSLFIHFDRPITSSTIPHYDWITYYDYYYPQNRTILNDTTLVLVFDGHQTDRFAEENAYSFKVTSADGIESEVSVSIPVYHHHVLVSGYLRQLSFYNDYKEVLFVQGKKIGRLDYITGETVREYDLSELPGNYLSYVKNRSNGMLYLVCSDSYDTIPDIYLLDPDTGVLRVAGTVPEDPFDSYYQYRQPIALSFTKYGTGLVVLRSNQTSGHRLQVVHVADDGSLSFSSPFMDAEVRDAYSMYAIENLSLDMDGSSIYGFSYMGSAYYFIFDGETCRFRLGFSTPDHKQNAVAHKKDGSWLMRETHHQFHKRPGKDPFRRQTDRGDCPFQTHPAGNERIPDDSGREICRPVPVGRLRQPIRFRGHPDPCLRPAFPPRPLPVVTQAMKAPSPTSAAGSPCEPATTSLHRRHRSGRGPGNRPVPDCSFRTWCPA